MKPTGTLMAASLFLTRSGNQQLPGFASTYNQPLLTQVMLISQTNDDHEVLAVSETQAPLRLSPSASD